MKILRNFWLLLFLGISFISVLEKGMFLFSIIDAFFKFFYEANLFLVNAADEDTVEGEDSDSVKVDGNDVTKTSEDDEDTVEGYKSSPDADIIYMFTKPVGDGLGSSLNHY